MDPIQGSHKLRRAMLVTLVAAVADSHRAFQGRAAVVAKNALLVLCTGAFWRKQWHLIETAETRDKSSLERGRGRFKRQFGQRQSVQER